MPPVTSTLPVSVNSTAPALVRALAMLPVAVKVPVAGSYSSAVARSLTGPTPPAISTFPVGSSVAVWPLRVVVMLPVGAKVPVEGL